MQNIEQGKVVGEGTGVERCAVLKARTARISMSASTTSGLAQFSAGLLQSATT